jgi:DNA-binding NarL/FixJ family response regulator
MGDSKVGSVLGGVLDRALDGAESPRATLLLMLVGDHAVRRAALARLLEDWSYEEGFALTIATEPSDAVRLALFDIGGTPAGAPEVQQRLADLVRGMPMVPVVVLSDRDETGDVLAAFTAGARGFVGTRTDPRVMVRALKFILGGGAVFPPEALLAPATMGHGDRRRAPEDATAAASAGGTALTARQGEVLRLLRQGWSNKQIARALGMCESTVKVHVRQLLRKLGAANRTQAAILAHPSAAAAAAV